MLLYGADFIGVAYGLGSALCGVVLIAAGFRLSLQPSRAAAHSLLTLSLIYLPVILTAVVLDRYGGRLFGYFYECSMVGWSEF
jgi:heme O synthase-like polyprenyltransferase